MSEEESPLTKAAFEESQWQGVIGEISPKKCSRYYRVLFAKTGEEYRKGNLQTAKALKVIAALAALHLNRIPHEEPFGNVGVPEDIFGVIESSLDVLTEIVDEVVDAEMRARIADVLWVKRRLYRMARLAINSYLEAANTLEDVVNWGPFHLRIERAIELWARLGGLGNSDLPDVISYIENKLDSYDGEDPDILSAKLMMLIQQQRQGDIAKYAALAEKAATNNPSSKCPCQKPVRARFYWQAKADWHALERNEEAQQSAEISAAETYVEEAEGHLICRPGTYLIAVWNLQRAIEAYRQIANTSKRSDEIYRQMLDYQQKSVEQELRTVRASKAIELSEFAVQAREMVKGKPLNEAILLLARVGPGTNSTKLREFVNEIATSDSLSFHIPVFMVNSEGKTVGRRESFYMGTPEEQETAIKLEMFRQATSLQDAFAQGILLPAIQQINIEHSPRVGDFNFLTENNPFIPIGREYIYTRGLHAGLLGDYLTAVHLLVPQLEHSVRFLLHQARVRVTGLDSQGIQDEHLLGSLLGKPELVAILSEDIVFELQGLLNERMGSNLRNLIAHGLLDTPVFFTNRIIYLWWLVLHLCCIALGVPPDPDEEVSSDEELASSSSESGITE